MKKNMPQNSSIKENNIQAQIVQPENQITDRILNKNKKFVLYVGSYQRGSSDYNLLLNLCEGLVAMGNIDLVSLGTYEPNSRIQYVKNASQAIKSANAQLFLPADITITISGLMTSLHAGCVPIVPKTPKLNGIVENFDPMKERGNGFIYDKADIWNIFATIIRATENYRFPYDWENLVEACRKS